MPKHSFPAGWRGEILRGNMEMAAQGDLYAQADVKKALQRDSRSAAARSAAARMRGKEEKKEKTAEDSRHIWAYKKRCTLPSGWKLKALIELKAKEGDWDTLRMWSAWGVKIPKPIYMLLPLDCSCYACGNNGLARPWCGSRCIQKWYEGEVGKRGNGCEKCKPGVSKWDIDVWCEHL